MAIYHEFCASLGFYTYSNRCTSAQHPPEATAAIPQGTWVGDLAESPHIAHRTADPDKGDMALRLGIAQSRNGKEQDCSTIDLRQEV